MGSLHHLVLGMVHIQDTYSLYLIHLITIWNKTNLLHPEYVILHYPVAAQTPRLHIPLYHQTRI